jgi:hypothetical protein
VPGSVFRPIVPVWVKNGDTTLGTYSVDLLWRKRFEQNIAYKEQII